MNAHGRRLSIRWSVAGLAALALLAAGAGAAYVLLRPALEPPGPAQREARTVTRGEPSGGHAGMAPPPREGTPGRSPSIPGDARLPDVTITLSEETVARSGIEITTVATGASTARLRLPGVVEPNAYRQVVVTPIVAGRVTRVLAALGDRVRRGQTLAQVYSPELAEAQTQYLTFSAELEAAHQQLLRTERLVQIGAASRQDLERVRAEHTAHATHVQGARSRLVLLGLTAAQVARLSSASEINATTNVPAPLNGVITERGANAGLNVDASTKLFTVVDLSTVWIVGDLYERDFSRVRVGSPAMITTTAYPGLTLPGRVSYIDPQVNPETRTARLRVEVGNLRGELWLGMYAEMQIGEAGGGGVVMIPRTALQNVGDRWFVYLVRPGERGRFIEREVQVGRSSGEQMEVLSGLQPGDTIVSKGSFLLRAERERLGLRQDAAPTATTSGASGASPQPAAGVQVARVTVSEQGFAPARVVLRAGAPARITFVRTTDATCGTEIVFPSLNIRRALPLNEPVEVAFTPAKPGEIAFVCGMNMLRGRLVVE